MKAFGPFLTSRPFLRLRMILAIQEAFMFFLVRVVYNHFVIGLEYLAFLRMFVIRKRKVMGTHDLDLLRGFGPTRRINASFT